MNMPADLNKLLDLPRENISLKALGGEIRALISSEEDVRLALAIRLAGAKRLVDARKGTNQSWEDWCRENVVKRDGQPYAPDSITLLLKIGASPDPAGQLAKVRGWQNAFDKDRYYVPLGRKTGRKSAATAKNATPQVTISKAEELSRRGRTAKQIAVELGVAHHTVRHWLSGRSKSREYYEAAARAEATAGELHQLQTLWDRAGPEARRQFMHANNLRSID